MHKKGNLKESYIRVEDEIISLIKNPRILSVKNLKKILKSNKVNTYYQDYNGYTMLDHLLNEYIKNRLVDIEAFLDIAQVLLDIGADSLFEGDMPTSPRSPLLRSVMFPNLDQRIFRLFLEDVIMDQREDVERLNYSGLSSGETSYVNGHLHEEMVYRYRTNDYVGLRVLLELGANPNYQDLNGNTILHTIYRTGEINEELSVDRVLIEYGVNPQIRNANGLTPLDLAISFSQQHMLERINRIINKEVDQESLPSEESTLIDEIYEEEEDDGLDMLAKVLKAISFVSNNNPLVLTNNTSNNSHHIEEVGINPLLVGEGVNSS